MMPKRIPSPNGHIILPHQWQDPEIECEHACWDSFTTPDLSDRQWRFLRSSLACNTEPFSMDPETHPALSLVGSWWEDYRVEREPGRYGDLEICHTTFDDWYGYLSNDQLTGRMIPPGRWARLVEHQQDEKRVTWMSDTPAEVADNLEFFWVAHERVLINGLGLGVIPELILRSKPCVTHMDIVERNADLIALISPYLQEWVDEGRLTIHHDDAFAIWWPQGTRWNVIWHDIWASIDDRYLTEMHKLVRRYRGRAAWQGCWSRREAEMLRNQIRALKTAAGAA